MKFRSHDTVSSDLVAAGVPLNAATTLAQGAGLSGPAANVFAAAHRGDYSLSVTQENSLLSRIIGTYEDVVRNSVTIRLGQDQYDTLVSFAFNLQSPFKNSQFIIDLNNGNFDAAMIDLTHYVNSGGTFLPGLLNRRLQEVVRFRTITQ